MNMDITGKIIAVLEPRGGVSARTGNSWKTQEYVLETQEQYPRKVCFEVFGEDKINQFAIQVGQDLTVSFDIDAREWNGRWFNSVRAWRVQPAQAATPGAGPSAPGTDALPPLGSPVDIASGGEADSTDDLPF